MKFLNLLIFLLFYFISFAVFAQQPHKNADQKEKIEIIQPAPDYLEGVTIKGKQIRKLVGHVHLKQNTVLISCDSAYLNPVDNNAELFGNVRINQSDTITMTSDKAIYNGNTKSAKATGNVILTDPKSKITTEEMDFNMATNTAYYLSGGKIEDTESTLTSKRGYYNTKTKMASFRKEVVVNNPQFKMESDTLQYSTLTKMAYFEGPTSVTSKDGTLHTTNGEYNTLTQVSNFKSRTTVEYQKYKLTGDTLYNDKKNEIGLARGNVELFSKEDNVTILGDVGSFNGPKGISKVYGRPVMKSIVDKDTMYLTADTLIRVDNKINKEKKLFAFHKVRIFKSDMQGKCDSLIYNFSDSTIYFYKDPVLWNKENQMKADTIHVQMDNNKMDRMYLRTNAFVVSQDSLLNFNQIKGRNMMAKFDSSEVKKIIIDGNAESIYFALNDTYTATTGMNKVICSKIIVSFSKNVLSKKNELDNIVYLKQPDATFTPPHEILEPMRRLKGFKWRASERPTKETVMVRPLNKKVSKKVENKIKSTKKIKN